MANMDADGVPPFVPPTGNRSINYQPDKYTKLCPWPGCDKMFVCNHNLNQHIKEKHTKVKPHACAHCKATFVRRGALNRHESLIHDVDNGYGKGRKRKITASGDETSSERSLEQSTAERISTAPQLVMKDEYAGQLRDVLMFNNDELTADDAFFGFADQPLLQRVTADEQSLQERPDTFYYQNTPATAPFGGTQAGPSYAVEGMFAQLLDPALTAVPTFASPYYNTAPLERPHVCPFCGARFDRLETLALHFHKLHDSPPFSGCTCERCIATYGSSRAQQQAYYPDDYDFGGITEQAFDDMVAGTGGQFGDNDPMMGNAAANTSYTRSGNNTIGDANAHDLGLSQEAPVITGDSTLAGAGQGYHLTPTGDQFSYPDELEGVDEEALSALLGEADKVFGPY